MAELPENAVPASFCAARNMRLLEAVVLEEDTHTTSWLVKVLMAPDWPEWDWKRVDVLSVLKSARAADAALVLRFHAALELWGKGLNHPNIVQAWQHAELAGAHVALVEYVAGHTLDRLCRAVLAGAHGFSTSMAQRIADAIDMALRALHGLGLAHGDVRAERVQLADDGQVILALGTPWDELASIGEDLHSAAKLRGALNSLVCQDEPRGEVEDLARFTNRVCGAVPNPFAQHASPGSRYRDGGF